jgi:beta-1,4-mannosyl-glycoprotein beta-1,4-N-acetylglucosaminyltransferase
MKIFDCFLFFNELDLLELRLSILNEHVDYFVIVEAAQTFQGDDKDYIFEKNKIRYSKYLHKIIHFKVEKYSFDFSNLPYVANPQNIDDQVLNQIYTFIDNCPHFDKKKEFWWGNDFYQRECIWRALAKNQPHKNDLILISDVDEIPDIKAINEIKNKINPNILFCLEQHEFCYFLNYYHNSNWLGTCCFLYDKFSNISLNAIRFAAKRNENLSPIIIKNAGWHFTSIGNIENIKKKISSWGHRELNTKAVLGGIDYNVRHGYDIFRRPNFGRLQYLNFDNSLLPSYIVNHFDKYKHLFGSKIKKEFFIQRLLMNFYFKISKKISNSI